MELQRLEFYVSRMRNLVICYFVFKNQSHYSGIRGQRVKLYFILIMIHLDCIQLSSLYMSFSLKRIHKKAGIFFKN